MKVLWFTNTPSLASNIIGKEHYVGGWISSLERLISPEPEIDLGIAFFSSDFNNSQIEKDKTVYFPIFKNKLSLKERYLHKQNDKILLDKCKKIISVFNPDVIHVFGTEHIFAGLSQITKKPIVIHLQGLLWPYTQSWLPEGITLSKVLANSSIYKFIKGSGTYRSYYRMKNFAHNEIKNIKLNQHFTGRTEWDKAYIQLLNPVANYYHINEVLRKPFYLQEWNYMPKDKLCLLSSIGPNIYKGLDMVLKTADILKNKNRTNFEWNIIGIKETDEIVLMIEKFFNKKFPSINVNFLGLKNPKEIVRLMKEHHLFIHPSHIDNSPNSVCEAMIVGIPVIAAHVGGVGSLIDNNLTGFLYEDNNVDQLIKTITNSSLNPELLKKISSKSKMTAQKRHNQNKIKNDTINLYKKLCGI